MSILHLYLILMVIVALVSLLSLFIRELRRREKQKCLRLLNDIQREAKECSAVAASGSTLVMQLSDLKVTAIKLEKQFERAMLTGASEAELDDLAVGHLWSQLLTSKLARSADCEVQRVRARKAAVAELSDRLHRLSAAVKKRAFAASLPPIEEHLSVLEDGMSKLEELLSIGLTDVDPAAEREIGQAIDAAALDLLNPAALLARLKNPAIARRNIQRCLILKRAKSILRH